MCWESNQENNLIDNCLKKMPRNHLTKEVKDLNNENYKTLKNKMEVHTKKMENLSWSWVGRINIVKMAILLKAICKFNLHQWFSSQK
jgi:hypothetical protein